MSSRPFRVAHGVGEGRAGPEPGAGQEHQDAELTEHDVGAVPDLPRDPAGSRQVAEDEADDQRAATGAELQMDIARQRDRHCAQQQPGSDTDGEADRIDLCQPPLGVAEEAGDGDDLLSGRRREPGRRAAVAARHERSGRRHHAELV